MLKSALAVVLIGGVVGCVTQQPGGAKYIDPGTVIPGTPGSVTMYDLESCVQRLVQKMLAHPQFAKNYSAAKAAKAGKLPIVVNGNIANLTSDRVQGRLDSANDTIRAMLFDSALFEVKNDNASDAIKSRIISGADGGIENVDALMQSFGAQEAPDFIVLGDLRHFADVGGYHTYKLRIAIHSLKTGKVVWEGIESRVKL
jgi:hypothetical protein